MGCGTSSPFPRCKSRWNNSPREVVLDLGPGRPWHLRSETENARKFHHMISPPTRISGEFDQENSNAFETLKSTKGHAQWILIAKPSLQFWFCDIFSQCQMRRPCYAHLIRNPKAGTAKAWLSMGFGHRFGRGGPRDAGPHIYIYKYCECLTYHSMTCNRGLQWFQWTQSPSSAKQRPNLFSSERRRDLSRPGGGSEAVKGVTIASYRCQLSPTSQSHPHARLYPTVVAVPSVGESSTGAKRWKFGL